MSDDEAIASAKVSDVLNVNVDLTDTPPTNAWVSRPVSQSVNEAMERAPLGAMHEITYAALSRRLKDLLSTDLSLVSSVVHTAVNFRALNPNFGTGGGYIPTIPPNYGAGAHAYQSAIFAPNKDERLPSTAPDPTNAHVYAEGQNPNQLQDKGLLIAKLFADLEHHLPVVLFNLTSESQQPFGVGGSAATKRFYRNGQVISELGYRAMLSVEATAVCEDDESAANLQGIIKAAFSVLRDQIGTGATVSGRSWQLTLPTTLSPSPVTELDAPWSQGDDKGGKLYTATVGLENMMFECFTYVGKPVGPLISEDTSYETDGPASITLASGDTSPSDPMRLRLGVPQRLILANAPVTSDLSVSQLKRVVDIRKPYQGSGVYEIIPRRTGEATLFLYDTPMTVSATTSEKPAGRLGSPLAERKVVVTAV